MHAHSELGFPTIFPSFWFQSTFLLKLKIDSIKDKNHSFIATIKIPQRNIGHLTVILHLIGMKLRKGLCPSCSREPCVLGELGTQRMPNTPVRSYPSKEGQPKHRVRVLSGAGSTVKGRPRHWACHRCHLHNQPQRPVHPTRHFSPAPWTEIHMELKFRQHHS